MPVPFRGESLIWTLSKSIRSRLKQAYQIELQTLQELYNVMNKNLDTYRFPPIPTTYDTIERLNRKTTDDKADFSLCEIDSVNEIGDVSTLVLSQGMEQLLGNDNNLIGCWNKALACISNKSDKQLFSPAALRLMHFIQQNSPQFPMHSVVTGTGDDREVEQNNTVISCPMCPNKMVSPQVRHRNAYAHLLDHIRNSHKSIPNPSDAELPTKDVFREFIWRIISIYRDSIVRSDLADVK